MKMVGKERNEQQLNIDHVCSDLNDLERYVEDLTSFIPIPLVTLNPSLKIIDINNSFLFTTGYAQYEILSATIDILFKNQQDIQNIIKKTHDADVVKNYESIILAKEKKEIQASVTCVPRKDNNGSIIGYFVAFIDITGLKKIEQSLQEKLDTLQKSELATLNIMEDLQNTIHSLTVAEMEIRDKNNELKKINSELLLVREELTLLNKNLEKKVQERTADVEKLLKQKDEFINQLGHDLKTPLTPLNILIPLIQEREQDPKLRELLDVVSNNIQYMKNLVIKTLALAQLNSLHFEFGFENINLSHHVQRILDMDLSIFEGKNVRIQNNIPKDILVHADFLQMKELFDNLFSNAIKYSHDSGVTITLDAQKKDDAIIISIKDNGIGLESDELSHVFDEFYKVDSSRHDLHSTGLGLSICKRIVEKHGGRIWVESLGKGKGSTFFFTLNPSKN